jgi:DNA primase large subunit
LEDALSFWRDEFTKKIDADKFEKLYAYNIRHSYGKEGKRTNYTPFSCMKIIMSSVGHDDAHGCPFRHSDLPHLKQQLLEWNIPVAEINEVAEYVSQGHFQLACGKYFQLTHGIQSDVNINHPNQYFVESQNVLSESQNVLSDKHVNRATERGMPDGRKVAASATEDLWGTDVDLESFDVDMQ